MRRHSHRASTRSTNRLQLAYETLEPKVLLACDMRLLDSGILQITGDEAPQTVRIVDRGNGMVNVQCREPGVRDAARNFSGVTGIKGDLKGGDDVLNYYSNQDVNAALPMLEFLMGTGNDRANIEVTVTGTPDRARGFGFVVMAGAGDDSLITRINSLTTTNANDPTQPVMRGEMHGGAGRDEMTLISNTSVGGFTLTSRELGPSQGTTNSQPDCLIWDLIDESTGQVSAQVMGSEADEIIELRTDPRGVGRSSFDFVLDGGGGVNALNAYMYFTGDTQGKVNGSCTMSKGAEIRLQVDGIVDLDANSNSAGDGTTDYFFTIDTDEGRVSAFASLDIVGSESADNVRINVGESHLTDMTINVDARGGNDSVLFQMFLADGTPVRNAQIDMYGGAGNDRLSTVVNTLVDSGFPDRPVMRGEMHGGDGRDEMTLLSNTSAGGFTLTNKELGPSQGQTASQPGCLIWDLVDGSTGQVNAHAMGSEAESLVTLRTDERGVGRSDFNFVIDAGAGEMTLVQVNLIFVVSPQGQQGGHMTILEAYESQLDVRGIVELSASTSADTPIAATRFDISIDGDQADAVLDIVGSSGDDDIVVRVGENRLDSLAINIDAGNGNDNVASHIRNMTNNGRFQQTIDTGGGSDTVLQSLQGFQNHGTARFQTRLGAGADFYRAVASDIYVAQNSLLAMRVHGGGGDDLIRASVQGTVDGAYRFVARGGRGADNLRVVQEIDTNWRRGDARDLRPTIDIRLEGNDGDDFIGLWLLTDPGNEDLFDALVDGGFGEDTASTRGPIRVINVEHHY